MVGDMEGDTEGDTEGGHGKGTWEGDMEGDMGRGHGKGDTEWDRDQATAMFLLKWPCGRLLINQLVGAACVCVSYCLCLTLWSPRVSVPDLHCALHCLFALP